MNIYAENILDHFRHPRHYEPLLTFTTDHEEWNHACGDSIHVWVKIGKDIRHAERSRSMTRALSLDSARDDTAIAEIGWTGGGCAISQASMSILSEELAGMTEEEVLTMTKDDVHALLGISVGPRRIKCALMSLHTVKNALHKAAGRPLQSWIETVALEKEE